MARKARAKIWRGFAAYNPKGELYEISTTEDGARSRTAWGYVRTSRTITRSHVSNPEDLEAAAREGWTVRPVKIIPQ
jgi:hypothetical protein